MVLLEEIIENEKIYTSNVVIIIVFFAPFAALEVHANDDVGSCKESVFGFDLDLRQSFIVSLITLCIPGILENIWRYNQIECKALYCYYNALKTNIDPTFCEDLRSFERCAFFVNQLFYDQLIDQMKSFVDNILRNPVGVVYEKAIQLARCTAQGSCCPGSAPKAGCLGLDALAASSDFTGTICLVSAMTAAANDILAVVAQGKVLIEQVKKIGDLGGDGVDYCKEVEDIGDEINEALEEQKKSSAKTPEVTDNTGGNETGQSSEAIQEKQQNNLDGLFG